MCYENCYCRKYNQYDEDVGNHYARYVYILYSIWKDIIRMNTRSFGASGELEVRKKVTTTDQKTTVHSLQSTIERSQGYSSKYSR